MICYREWCRYCNIEWIQSKWEWSGPQTGLDLSMVRNQRKTLQKPPQLLRIPPQIDLNPIVQRTMLYQFFPLGLEQIVIKPQEWPLKVNSLRLCHILVSSFYGFNEFHGFRVEYLCQPAHRNSGIALAVCCKPVRGIVLHHIEQEFPGMERRLQIISQQDAVYVEIYISLYHCGLLLFRLVCTEIIRINGACSFSKAQPHFIQ